MTRPQNITILGSTGTIGVNTLDVIARHPQRYRAYALTAHSRTAPLLEQCRRFKPAYAVVGDEDAAETLAKQLKNEHSETQVLCGAEALEKVVALPEVDAVMAAIVGAAGLRPALAAARAGKRVLLANKETLVMSGKLFMDAVRQNGATLLPIDSEHNAIFQVMPRDIGRGLEHAGVSRILLTASGGPFRTCAADELARVTPAQALNHPNWVMGPKITIDSATLMNKGLEVIEAHWLFDAAPEQIEVVIHPQSVIHSMVEYIDGSVLAQLGNPDMRTPIAYALAWPERIPSGVGSLDLFRIARLDFEAPDTQRFPCLRLAFEALRRGGTAPAILNAANEIAVQAFLGNRIGFTDIPRLIEATLSATTVTEAANLEELVAVDRAARRVAENWVEAKAA
ncbi:MAG: 1-deoxy-D-xylulose-5-phosphate reductoisomerase [Methylobacillus sp.]|jgi:1-deoxy-D-xylulose-5-phosphate reductoisomerase|nr:1-deoxy-D-xylulose-5-phosphate reductoisomerase [Methylobacillus sp.]